MADHDHALDDGAHHGGHSHVHDHNAIPWTAFRTNRVLQGVLGLIVVAAVATAAMLIALWPSGDATDDASSQGARVGLGSFKYAATVTDVVDVACSYSTPDRPQDCRIISYRVDEGPDIGLELESREYNVLNDAQTPSVSAGDPAFAGFEPATNTWFFWEEDRRGTLVVLAAIFGLFVVALGRLRGVAALLGMMLTVGVLVWFVAPSVLEGNDPLLVAVVAAAAIAFVSLYLTHGPTPTTTVALAGTLVSLMLTLGLASLFFRLADFNGLATEDAQLLPAVAGNLNLSSLLLGGAVLGTLGALDDVTVTQVSTVAELHRRSPLLGVGELVTSGIRVGRDHIASTVNTLLLAYAGASMPLLLLFAVSNQTLSQVANTELIAVEIVRTLCGSVGLVAAVPITTVLAALVTQHVNDDSIEVSEPENAPLRLDKPPQLPDTPPLAPIDVAESEAAVVAEASESAPSWDDFAPDSEARDF